jgi:hypothetical protein
MTQPATELDVDDQGLPFADYPNCPFIDCDKSVGISRNTPRVLGMQKQIKNSDKWYCHCCGRTFNR